jgi:FlaA1/EpsC-like NDP-sugar epimerase
MNVLKLLNREKSLFDSDVTAFENDWIEEIKSSKFLVLGGAGSIGQAVTRELFKRKPRVLHVVDISENNMVELVRDIRSTLGYLDIDFRTFAIDCGGKEFEALMNAENSYDYVLNLSALKHVRSEKDPYTLMRMIHVNILNTVSTIKMAQCNGAKKYFCVSTDKAANPVNMMGATKSIMEAFLMRESHNIPISTARFANVAFSDGSLLHGFNQRFAKGQPISAPNDVRRFFLSPQEAGELCLLSSLTGNNRDIYFPKSGKALRPSRFSEIAIKYLEHHNYTPFECQSEDEARIRIKELLPKRQWPVYFFNSDTTGEKDIEEFYTKNEIPIMNRFRSIGVINKNLEIDIESLDCFIFNINCIMSKKTWNKQEIVDVFNKTLKDFEHKEMDKYLDDRM